MMPDVSIIDPQLAASQPRELLAAAAYGSLSLAVESFFSVMASELTLPLSLQVRNMPNSILSP